MVTSRKSSFALAILLLLTASPARALCSEAVDREDRAVVILRCDGVVLAVEATAVRSPLAMMSSHPNAIQLDAGAIAIASSPRAPPFAALTPDAVASAVDGEWAILAEAGDTRASVWRGRVTLMARIDGSERLVQAQEIDAHTLDAGRAERLRRALHRALASP